MIAHRLIVLGAVIGASLAIALSMRAWGENLKATNGQEGIVSGLIVDESTGMPLSGKVVVSEMLPNGDAVIAPSVVPSSGAFSFKPETTMLHTIVAVSPGYGQGVVLLRPDLRGEQRVIVELARAAAIEGAVRDASNDPAIGASLSVVYIRSLGDRVAVAAADRGLSEGFVVAEGTWESGRTRTEGAAGSFSISDIDPRRPFRLRAEHAVLGTVETLPMTLDPGERITDFVIRYGQ